MWVREWEEAVVIAGVAAKVVHVLIGHETFGFDVRMKVIKVEVFRLTARVVFRKIRCIGVDGKDHVTCKVMDACILMCSCVIKNLMT